VGGDDYPSPCQMLCLKATQDHSGHKRGGVGLSGEDFSTLTFLLDRHNAAEKFRSHKQYGSDDQDGV